MLSGPLWRSGPGGWLKQVVSPAALGTRGFKPGCCHQGDFSEWYYPKRVGVPHYRVIFGEARCINRHFPRRHGGTPSGSNVGANVPASTCPAGKTSCVAGVSKLKMKTMFKSHPNSTEQLQREGAGRQPVRRQRA